MPTQHTPNKKHRTIRNFKDKPKFVLRYIVYFKWINLPKQICIHLLGERHPQSHRVIVGIILAGVGVWFSKLFEGIIVLHYICDGIGYMIHGIATIPIAEMLAKVANQGDGNKNGNDNDDETIGQEDEYDDDEQDTSSICAQEESVPNPVPQSLSATQDASANVTKLITALAFANLCIIVTIIKLIYE